MRRWCAWLGSSFAWERSCARFLSTWLAGPLLISSPRRTTSNLFGVVLNVISGDVNSDVMSRDVVTRTVNHALAQWRLASDQNRPKPKSLHSTYVLMAHLKAISWHIWPLYNVPSELPSKLVFQKTIDQWPKKEVFPELKTVIWCSTVDLIIKSNDVWHWPMIGEWTVNGHWRRLCYI